MLENQNILWTNKKTSKWQGSLNKTNIVNVDVGQHWYDGGYYCSFGTVVAVRKNKFLGSQSSKFLVKYYSEKLPGHSKELGNRFYLGVVCIENYPVLPRDIHSNLNNRFSVNISQNIVRLH